MRLSHLLTLIGLLFTIPCQSQLRIDKVIPPSFNSSALIKYCDHPVGIQYGVPKVKFPIGTLINNDLFIPVSMNYHALGIKVEEESSWVGLGWYLEAGGTITRIIRGENDLGVIDEKENSKALGYPFEHIKPCFEDCEDNENDEFHAKVCAGEIDSDPDIFFFNILGMKGKFFLAPDHDPKSEFISVKLITPQEMTATFFLTDNHWEIKEQRGFVYIFKTREVTINHNYYLDYKFESHQAQFDHQIHQATSSWYLDEIRSPMGAVAKFEYDLQKGSSPYLSEGAYQKMNINDGDIWDVHYSSYCFPENIDNVQINSINIYRDIYPKSITSGEYRVDFYKSEQAHMRPPSNMSPRTGVSQKAGFGRQQLDSVVVKKSGEIIASGQMHYSVYRASQTESLGYLHRRLRLDSMTIETSKRREMLFEYQETTGMPSKESHARDQWGFFNGEEDAHNITPSDFYNYSQPEKLFQEDGKVKHYSLDNIQEGVLNKITYVGGRVTEFYYDHQEFNTVSEEILSHFTDKMKESNFSHHIKPFLFGGLRIKSIIEHYPRKDLYQDFYYTINKVEGGQLTISHYSHDHHGYGYKTSGNHTVRYDNVSIKSGVLFNGRKF